MAVKRFPIRIEEEMLEKLSYVANYEGRSANSHVLVPIRENIRAFEQANGKIEGMINPDINVKAGKNKEKQRQHRCFFVFCLPAAGEKIFTQIFTFWVFTFGFRFGKIDFIQNHRKAECYGYI